MQHYTSCVDPGPITDPATVEPKVPYGDGSAEAGECYEDGECWWTAKLTCPTHTLTRGDVALCEFEITPVWVPHVINGWSFLGDNNLWVPDLGAMWYSWEGQVVESGEVMVSFDVNGGLPQFMPARIEVNPRTTGIWATSYWESQINLHEGDGSMACKDADRVNAMGPIGEGSRLGWVQTLESAQANQCAPQQILPLEYPSILEITSGPNQGAFFITDVPYHWTSATLIHESALPSAAPDTLTATDQVQLCGTALINLWNYNNSCAQVPNWAAFLDAAWAHERQHFEQAEAVLLSPSHNIYETLEAVVATSLNEMYDFVNQVYYLINDAAHTASNNPHPSGNWTPPPNWWIWASVVLHKYYSPKGICVLSLAHGDSYTKDAAAAG